MRAEGSECFTPSRRAPTGPNRTVGDRRSRFHQRDQGERTPGDRGAAARRRPGHGRYNDIPLRDRTVTAPLDYEPISVALKFGFLAVLYLFLLWIANSARKD